MAINLNNVERKMFIMGMHIKDPSSMEAGNVFTITEEHYGCKWIFTVRQVQNRAIRYGVSMEPLETGVFSIVNVVMKVGLPRVDNVWEVNVILDKDVIFEKNVSSTRQMGWPEGTYDQIEAEIHVTVIRSYNDLLPLKNFFGGPSSTAVHIAREVFYVDKNCLSSQSGVFKQLMDRMPVKKHEHQSYFKKSILRYVDSYDFARFMDVYYGSPITEQNVEGVLLVGHTLQVKKVIERCENFLSSKSTKPSTKLFQISVKYDLSKLTLEVIPDLQVYQIKDFLYNERKQVDEPIRTALLDHCTELTRWNYVD